MACTCWCPIFQEVSINAIRVRSDSGFRNGIPIERIDVGISYTPTGYLGHRTDFVGKNTSVAFRLFLSLPNGGIPQ
jgi:hypothetical protein